MTSLYYNYQNASVCCFIVLIKATVSLNLGGIDKLNKKAKRIEVW